MLPTWAAKEVAPDPDKIQAVQEWPVPSTIAGVQQFLGVALCYCWYIECLSYSSPSTCSYTKMLHFVGVLEQDNHVITYVCKSCTDQIRTEL